MQNMILKLKHNDAMQKNVGMFALLAVVVAVVAMPEHAMAAATDPFAALLTTITGWITGSLGKLLATVALVVAGFAGATGSLRTAIVAFGLAMILAFGPAIITAIFPAAAAG